MSSFYGRRWELFASDQLFIQGGEGRQFKIEFEILVDFGGYQSYADISVFNLTDDTAQQVFRRGESIGLRAGYIDSIDFIFRGTIRNVLKERRGPDRITRIIAYGGSLPDRTINQTLGRNTRITSIIQACAEAMGFPLLINNAQFSNIPAYARGYVMNGDPVKILENLAATHNFSWVVENDRLVVVGPNANRSGPPYNVSQATGMEGIPIITEVGADVDVRMTSKIRIGGQINIQSELATFNFNNLYFQDIPPSAGTGIYNVQRLRYRGDSWGDPWTVTVTGIRPVN